MASGVGAAARGSAGPGRAVTVTATLVGLQALGLLGLAAFYLVETALGRADDARGAWITAALAALAGLALLLVARGLRRRRRWSRAPALVTQLFLLPLAVAQLQGGLWAVGAPLLLWALVLLGLLLSPPLGAALSE